MYEVKEISAADTFTDPITIYGDFNVSISGGFQGTVTLQREFGGDGEWHDINSWAEPFQGWDSEPGPPSHREWVRTRYRLGFKSGDYTSGTAKCRVGRP